MLERIKELCDAKKTTFKAVEKELGFANASIKKTNQNTAVSRIYALAKYFGVPMEYLYAGEKAEHLTTDEKELLRLCRSMNDAGRATLLSLAESMAMNDAYQKGKKLSESQTA